MSRFFIVLMKEYDEVPEDGYHSFYCDELNSKALHRSLVNLESSEDILFIEDTLEEKYKAIETGRTPKISVGCRKKFIKKVLEEW